MAVTIHWQEGCQGFLGLRATLSGRLFSDSVRDYFVGELQVSACKLDHRYCSHDEQTGCNSPDILFTVHRGDCAYHYRWQGHVGSIALELAEVSYAR